MAPGTPPAGARTWRRRLRLDKLDPLLPGGKRMTPTPPALALPLPSARGHPELHKPACPAAPLYAPPPKRVSRGRSLKPCVAFLFTFFFCIRKREQCSILPYLCFYSGTNVGCVRVCFLVLVFFFKEIGRRKLPLPFLAFCPRPLRSSDTLPPFCPALFVLCFVLFCFLLFCFFVLLRVYIPVCNTWFARFSVFSKVFLCQLGSPPPLSPRRGLMGWARPGPLPSPHASFPPLSSPAPRRGSRRGGGAEGEPAPGRGLHLWRVVSAI